MNRRTYLEGVEKDLERLLSNMDRNRDSDTFGCFSRPFWHDKITDFPSAHQQIGVLPLTIAYTEDWDGNQYYQNEKIGEYIDAALNFWAFIQKKNGSFDEHYPNEHSMGAVAWTLWAVTESYLMLEDPPEIESNIEKAANFLNQNDEPGDIANHQAVAASALVNSHRITDSGLETVENRLQNLENMQNSEGWFQEYIGADIGYQSTTISHIARVWDYKPELVDEEIINRSLEFFSNFIDRENHYARIIGSRNTEHIHPTGFEIFSDEFETAEKVANSVRRNKRNGNLLEPSQMDDKHFSRQLAEYMDSYRRAGNIGQSFNEIEERNYRTVSIIKPEPDTKIFLNTSKGGVYTKYEDGELVEKDNGLSISRSGETYTANWPGVTEKVERKQKSIELEGSLRKVPRNTLPGRYFLISRLFNYTFGYFPKLSLKAKNILISLLIDSNQDGPYFKREINWENGLEAQDKFEGSEVSGKVHTNFVPSSEFFDLDELRREG